MRALLCVAQRELREYLAFALEGEFHLRCVQVSNAAEAGPLLAAAHATDPFQIVICDYAKDGPQLVKQGIGREPRPHFFCGVDAPSSDPRLEKRKDWLHLFSSADWLSGLRKALLGSMPELREDKRPPELRFARLQVPVLLRLSPLAGDVYVQLSETKYVRVFHKGAHFEATDLVRMLANKKISNLYVKMDDFQVFLERIFAALPKTQSVAPAAPPQESDVQKREKDAARAKALALIAQRKAQEATPAAKEAAAVVQDLSMLLENVQKKSARLGFTQEVQQLTRQNVAATLAEIKKAPRLSQVLGQLRRDPDKYISSHSMMLAHVACALATQMEWKSDMTFNKLTLAAFLHDLPLANQKLAAIDSLKELTARKEEFTEDEFKSWKLHPMTGADTARAFSEVPPDVDLIIAQHHERPDGTGYPRGLTSLRLGPLSTVFIVAHDLVRLLFEKPDQTIEGLSVEELVTRYPGTYKFTQFKKLLQGLQNIKS